MNCDCGAEKTYGVSCSVKFHSDWCSVHRPSSYKEIKEWRWREKYRDEGRPKKQSTAREASNSYFAGGSSVPSKTGDVDKMNFTYSRTDLKVKVGGSIYEKSVAGNLSLEKMTYLTEDVINTFRNYDITYILKDQHYDYLNQILSNTLKGILYLPQTSVRVVRKSQWNDEL